MTEVTTRQAIAAKGKSGKLVVSGKLQTAVDFLVWHGLPRNQAAAAAGMSDRGLRSALRKSCHELFHE